jgi:cobalt-zinc-cadmium efflux system membrane fusion protein
MSVALLVSTLGACTPPRTAPPPETHTRRADRAVVLTGASQAYVRTEPALPAEQSHTRTLVARVAFDERNLAVIGPPVQGRVASVNVVTGDQVRAGDVLLTIHAPDIATAEAQVTAARNARLLAERTLSRATALVDQGAGSVAERQQAELALLQARTEEQRAMAALAALGGSARGASDYELRAPIAGTVVERNVSIGTEVHTDQSTPLVKVADLSTVWIVADVYEQDLPGVHLGDEATIELQAVPNQLFHGSISYISPTVDPQTRAAVARVAIQNPGRVLRAGMFAQMRVRGAAEGLVDVPINAVLARRDQFFVFVRNDDGSFAQREVRVGEQQGDRVTLLSGLSPGQQVVTDGAILLDTEANEAL